MNAGAVATPLPFVVAIAGLPPANVPLAPLPGGVNVTVTPATGVPDSATVACKFVGKTVLTVVLCGVPAVAVSV